MGLQPRPTPRPPPNPRPTPRLAKTPQEIGMATGATIHTANGMIMSVARRQDVPAGAAAAAAQPLAAV
jgi:hypothetical protein